VAARQCPGLRRYVTIENSETFAMIRLGGQTLACHGTMSTACCTVVGEAYHFFRCKSD
jgi:hypothetical protein